ncbi:MAG: tRNA (guanosine(46)-N7)-methyltransferase TrmB [Clostridia bacterium]
MLRQGRTTPAQRRALDELYPRYGISFEEKFLDKKNAFGRDAPLVLEIGSGMGETTAAIAQAHPEVDFLAIEVHGPGVGSLLNRIAAERLTNLRVIRHDASEVLEKMIGDGTLAGLHLFFPDPWPKKRHHKRRLVQPAFAELAARKLAQGGIFHAATDWPEYAEQIAAVLGASGFFQATGSGLVERPVTKFEARGQRLGHAIRDLYFRRERAPAAR